MGDEDGAVLGGKKAAMQYVHEKKVERRRRLNKERPWKARTNFAKQIQQFDILELAERIDILSKELESRVAHTNSQQSKPSQAIENEASKKIKDEVKEPVGKDVVKEPVGNDDFLPKEELDTQTNQKRMDDIR